MTAGHSSESPKFWTHVEPQMLWPPPAASDPCDRLELRQTEPIPAVVRHGSRAIQSEFVPRAPTLRTTTFRQKTRRQRSRLFAISAACDRGHAYCTPSCRPRRSTKAGRLWQKRARVAATQAAA